MIWNALIILFSVQLLIALVLMVGYGKTKKRKGPVLGNASGLTVIIPFRNEEDRILPLIESINKAHIPDNVEFIFVDDHSTDRTVATFTSVMRIPFELVRNDGQGKKSAIQTAVRLATHQKILTLDADVRFAPTFIIEAQFSIQHDLVIFPIRMNGRRLIQHLGSFEFSFLQLVTFGLASYGNPVLCNGANLGFNRYAFLEVDQERKDYQIASGDDIFLLNAMKEQGRSIGAYALSDLIVDTNAPETIGDLIRQRKRWFGKMTKMIDFYAFFGVFLLILSQIGLITALFCVKFSLWFLLPIGIKFFSEWIIDLYTFRKFKPLRFLTLIIHQIWYPIYLLLLLIPSGKEKRWSVQSGLKEE
ncbi:MAG: glycosyltransferase [Flavobacteriales bacterium]|nr:glycosyltransferase [Flavobacteriales bacterium]